MDTLGGDPYLFWILKVSTVKANSSQNNMGEKIVDFDFNK